MSDNFGALVIGTISDSGQPEILRSKSYFKSDVTIFQDLESYNAWQDKKVIYFTRATILHNTDACNMVRFWKSEPTEFIFNCTDGYNIREANSIEKIIKVHNLDPGKVTIQTNVIEDFEEYNEFFVSKGFSKTLNMINSEYPLVGISSKSMIGSKFVTKSQWFLICSRNNNQKRFFKFIDLMRMGLLTWSHFSFFNFQHLYANRDNKDLIPIETYDNWANNFSDNKICNPVINYWNEYRLEIYNGMPYTLPGEIEELGANIGAMEVGKSFIEAHNDCYISSVNETHNATSEFGSKFLPTEKIGKTMLLRKPFFVYSTRHYLKNLRNMGFKTFGDFWDESYDDEPNDYLRARMINEQLFNLRHTNSQTNMEYMMLKMSSIVDHNYNVMLEKCLDLHTKTVQGTTYGIDILRSNSMADHYEERIAIEKIKRQQQQQKNRDSNNS